MLLLEKAQRLINAVIKIYWFISSISSTNDKQLYQLILMNQYRQLASIDNLPKFHEVGFHSYSQTDEDGFLLYIFSLISTTNKKVIEMCCGAGIECNSANLIINHGWDGLLFDGDPTKIKVGNKLYDLVKSAINHPPKLVHAWINAENVNELIINNGFTGEVDLLSIDIDGIDYWIWKSINCINPRVVILEYNTYWGYDKSVTVPYDVNFKRQEIDGTLYCGASLKALVNLGKKLGYRLVGSNTQQFNAFFVRNDLGINVLPEVDIETCLELHSQSFISVNSNNYPNIARQPWLEV